MRFLVFHPLLLIIIVLCSDAQAADACASSSVSIEQPKNFEEVLAFANTLLEQLKESKIKESTQLINMVLPITIQKEDKESKCYASLLLAKYFTYKNDLNLAKYYARLAVAGGGNITTEAISILKDINKELDSNYKPTLKQEQLIGHKWKLAKKNNCGDNPNYKLARRFAQEVVDFYSQKSMSGDDETKVILVGAQKLISEIESMSSEPKINKKFKKLSYDLNALKIELARLNEREFELKQKIEELQQDGSVHLSDLPYRLAKVQQKQAEIKELLKI
ncbi:MAG: hypothetical protein P4L22_01415 [Candidatus Babeliales bacterium]|nr:hypothetical protein [Candidatus Babeliales bacterium]